MNHLLFVFVFSGALMATSCAGEPAPSAVLAKAVAAHGGEENINKSRGVILKGSGSNDAIPDSKVTVEEFVESPKRWKRITTGIHDGERRVSTLLFIDGKLWEWEEGEPARENKVDDMAGSQFGVLSILIESQGKDAKHTRLKATSIEGKRAVGIRVNAPHILGDYYFDAKSWLLLASEFLWKAGDGKERQMRTVFGDYKEHDGVHLPHRRTTHFKTPDADDWQLLTEFNITSLRIVDKLPDNTFVLPGK